MRPGSTSGPSSKYLKFRLVTWLAMAQESSQVDTKCQQGSKKQIRQPVDLKQSGGFMHQHWLRHSCHGLARSAKAFNLTWEPWAHHCVRSLSCTTLYQSVQHVQLLGFRFGCFGCFGSSSLILIPAISCLHKWSFASPICLSQLRHPAKEIASHHLHQSLEAWSLGASSPSMSPWHTYFSAIPQVLWCTFVWECSGLSIGFFIFCVSACFPWWSAVPTARPCQSFLHALGLSKPQVSQQGSAPNLVRSWKRKC